MSYHTLCLCMSWSPRQTEEGMVVFAFDWSGRGTVGRAFSCLVNFMSLERERVWVLWRLPRERPQFANGVSTFISVKPPDIFNKISISSYFLAVLVAAKTTFLKSSKTSAVVTEPVNAKAWSFQTLTKWVFVPELNQTRSATLPQHYIVNWAQEKVKF